MNNKEERKIRAKTKTGLISEVSQNSILLTLRLVILMDFIHGLAKTMRFKISIKARRNSSKTPIIIMDKIKLRKIKEDNSG